MGLLDDADIPILCQECGKETAKTIAWVKGHKEFACPGCGATIRVQSDQFRREVAKVEREWEKLRKKLGKGFDIKL